MRIAFLNMYNGLVDRGAETFVKEIAKRLSKKNTVDVFQAGSKTGDENYKVLKIPIKLDLKRQSASGTILSKLFLDYWSLKVLVFTIKSLGKIWKEKYDVVVPVNGGWMPALIRIITWLYGGRMVISGQAGIGWDETNNLYTFPDIFVPLSQQAEKWANKINPFVKTKKIPNGVDTERFKPKGETFKSDLERPVILCVGALTSSKRIDLVIDAVSGLEDASLLVVGDGDLRDEIKRKGQTKLGERFRLIKVPFEDMPQVYRSADLFTLVSKSYYAFEIVLVEAMASNLSVVANKDKIRKEIVGNAGILVNPSDLEEYTSSLKKALSKKWGNLPRKRAQKFDWGKIAMEYEDLFKSIRRRTV